jgi:hypothetical protein
MRLNEALHLRVSDIDFNEKVIRVSAAFTKKGDKREVPLIPELEEAIKKYLEKRQVQSVWLFPSLENPSSPMAKERAQDSFNQLLRRLGLDQRDPSGLGYQIHFHVFRKWHKTQLERHGVHRLVLERWQGRDIGSQGVYFLPTGDDLKRENEKAAEALKIFGRHEDVRSLEEKFEALKRYVETLRMALYAETGAIPSGVGFVEGGALKYYNDEELGLPRDIFAKNFEQPARRRRG